MDSRKWETKKSVDGNGIQTEEENSKPEPSQIDRWSIWGALTVCGLEKVAILPLNFHTKHTLQIYEKLSYEELNRHFCQTAVISCPSACPKCCRYWIYTELSTLFTVSSCCEQVRLLALSFAFAAFAYVFSGKSKCECKCDGLVYTVITIAGFNVRIQFYFQTSSNSNLSK